MTFPVPSGPSGILRTLRANGHEAFLVGGCVRDLLLGREPKDWDIATDARPAEVESLFSKTLPIGTAYAVWVGIGAAGAAVLGIVLFDEPANAARVLCLALLIVAVVGLRLTSGE